MQIRVYYNPHMNTHTHTLVNVNAALGLHRARSFFPGGSCNYR